MTRDSVLLIRVKIQEQGKYIFVTSPDVTGLNICGTSIEQACESAVKAIKILFEKNRGMKVDVIPATADDQNFPQMTGRCEQFAVQRLAA